MKLFILCFYFLLFGNFLAVAQKMQSDTTAINGLLVKANFFFKEKKYDSAAFYYQIANPMLADLGNKKNWIDKQIFLGLCYLNANQWEKARLFFEKNLQQSIASLGEDNELTAKNYYYLGNSYWKLQDTKNTLLYYEKSLAIREKVLGLWHDDVALSYQNLGVVYRNMANYEYAIKFYLKALAIREKTQGSKSAAVAAIYNNIGLVYKDWSSFEEAILYYNKSLHIKKQLYGEMHVEVAGTYNNIAGIYYHRQDYENSLLFHTKSLQIREKILPLHDIEIGASLENIGQVYRAMGKINNFFEAQHKALWITQKKLGLAHRYNADAYFNLSDGHLAKNQIDSAKIYADKALQIYTKLYTNRHYFIAAVYYQKSLIAQKEQNISQALDFCQQSLVENMPYFDGGSPDKHPRAAGYEVKIMRIKDFQEAMILKGNLLLTQYQATKDEQYLYIGFRHYLVFDSIAQRLLPNFTNENEKLYFNRNMAEAYKGAVATCFVLSAIRHKNFYAEKGFYFSEKSKSAVLSAALANTKAKKYAQIPDSLIQKERILNSLMAKTDEKILIEQIAAKDADKIDSLHNEFFELKKSHNELIASFEKNYPAYFNAKYDVTTASIAEISRSLDKNTALISYTIADTCLYVFTITKNNSQFARVTKSPYFDTQIKTLLNAIYYQVGSLYVKSAYILQQQLMPTNLPNRIKNIIFITEGSLLKLPFEALLSKPFTKKIASLDYTKLPYLVKGFAISYHYSANLFFQNLQSKTANPYKESYVAFAPIFTEESETNFLTKGCERAFYANDELYAKDSLNKADFLKDLAPTVLAEIKNANKETSRAFTRSGKFIAAIPKTKDEVENISKLHKDKNLFSKYYLFKDAKEEVIKSGELKNYTYIHFATHGFVNESLPELSGLLLAQDSLSKEDGVLYVGEIYNLDISQAELVTLSACETGLGKITSGEGVLGISRAFLYAGAKNLVVSLWKVADSSASELMLAFYNNLLNDKEKKKNKSLQDAKLLILKNKTFSKPYYWSPFILIGK